MNVIQRSYIGRDDFFLFFFEEKTFFKLKFTFSQLTFDFFYVQFISFFIKRKAKSTIERQKSKGHEKLD